MTWQGPSTGDDDPDFYAYPPGYEPVQFAPAGHEDDDEPAGTPDFVLPATGPHQWGGDLGPTGRLVADHLERRGYTDPGPEPTTED